MSKDKGWKASERLQPEETPGTITVLFPTIKDYRENITPSFFNFLRPKKPEFNAELINATILKQFQKDKSQEFPSNYTVHLSLNDVIKEIAARDSNSPFENCCLTLICVPANAVSSGTDIITEEISYSLNTDVTIKNFQLQYSLIIPSKEDFAARRFRHIVHPPYKALFNLISGSEPNIKSVMEEIKKLYQLNRSAVFKEKQFPKLLKTLSDRDLFSIYKSLNDYPFAEKQDMLLTQCILNIMAFSTKFYKQARSMMQNYYKNNLSFSTLLPTLPGVLHDIIFQYHAIEEIDIQKRRACIY